MNKNLLLKILGIISGLLVIVGLFLPYTKQSLWTIDINNNQIYLSIVMIVFAILPVVLHTVNKKTEFVYMSVGALGFFITIQLVDAISKGIFSAFGLGFYFILVGIVLMGIVTVISGKQNKVNVLNEQIAPISNNIADPIERKNMDPEYSQNLDNSLPLENENTESIQDDTNSNEEVVEALGEEIPEYQPEDGVNPVVSEFTNDANLSSETSESPAVEGVSNVNAMENSTSEQAPAVESPVEEVSTPAVEAIEPQPGSENPTIESPVGEVSAPVVEAAAPQPVSENPTVESPVEEVSTPSVEAAVQPFIFENAQPEVSVPQAPAQPVEVPQQNDILFEEPQQQEIPQESQEPQLDIFGQPK